MKKRIIQGVLLVFLLCTCLSHLSFAGVNYVECPSSSRTGWYWPVPASKFLSRGYKAQDYVENKVTYKAHLGIDIARASGKEVRAAKSGKVVRCYKGCKNVDAAGTKKSCTSVGCTPNDGTVYMEYYKITVCNHGYGNGVVIDHLDGTFSHYCHLRDTPLVGWGETVTQGQVIGYVGSSGCSDGAHLHFAIGGSADANKLYDCNPDSPDLKITVDGGSTGNPNWRTDKAYLYDPHGVSYITTLAKQDFDVNAMLDGTLMTNSGACGTFDVYIDGKLVQSNTTDFNGSYVPGTKYKIVARANPGYVYYGAEKQYWGDYVSGPVEGEILSHTTKVCLGFRTDPDMTFTVCGILDGHESDDLTGYATFDVWIDGKEVQHGVSKYSGTHQVNQTYEIKNINVAEGKTYIGAVNGGESGILQRGLGFVTLVINTEVELSNEWQYCRNLPLFPEDADVEIQYRYTWETEASESPGEGWTRNELIRTEYVNDGASYTSDFELATSETRALVSYYYYHWCAVSGDNANYAPTTKYIHYDTISNPSLVKVDKTHTDAIDSRYTIYDLKWTSSGGWAYCKSGTTCDGKSGTHGTRSYHWYRRYTYQNKKPVYTYKWTRAGNWQSVPEQGASVAEYRFRSRIPEIEWEFVLPGGLNVIDAEAFANDSSIRTVKLGDSVSEIGKEAFAGCTNLIYVYIPDSVVTIAQKAFDVNESLTLICETDNAGADYARDTGIHYLVIQRDNTQGN